jgi:hypothetical protein
MGKRDSCMSRTGQGFRSVDTFGKPINLNFRGQEYFKTSLGAFISLIWLAAVLAIISQKALQIVIK